MTRKEKFLQGFDDPEVNTLTILIDMPDCPAYEVIINTKPNFEAKKAYYSLAYNDNLELIAYPAIKIDCYAFTNEDCVEDFMKEEPGVA